MKGKDLTDVQHHFGFGKNWYDFKNTIDEESINKARENLEKLITKEEIKGKTFLDIGSGSGIHSLAALLNGAAYVYSIDIDDHSVFATEATIKNFYKGNNYHVGKRSIFDKGIENLEKFDIVYSWGVLHHTGLMHKAIDIAADLVASDGKLILALYSKTLLCRVWKVEKKYYTMAPEWIKKSMRAIFKFIVRLDLARKGKNYKEFIFNYKNKRGMSFNHDVHDWLGGYPYESITEKTLTTLLRDKGFEVMRLIPYEGKIGFLGTGCFEVTYKLTRNRAH
ncbi:MAG: class I SAM-dependent methyltransferase [Bacteroidota bacterium]|nr:class I SAM-dependent methyltransferase [Bacteroidota bacterium]